MLFNELNGSIKPGSKVGIIGNNGAGKSTLLNMIANGHEGIFIAKPVVLGFFHQQLENLDETTKQIGLTFYLLLFLWSNKKS